MKLPPPVKKAKRALDRAKKVADNKLAALNKRHEANRQKIAAKVKVLIAKEEQWFQAAVTLQTDHNNNAVGAAVRALSAVCDQHGLNAAQVLLIHE